MLEGYYKRYEPEKNYDKLYFRAGQGLQSAELNDLQEQFSHGLKKIADSILVDGDVIKGGELFIDTATGHCRIGAASVYLRGAIRELQPQALQIATDKLFYLGVWLTEQVITELEDPGLRDPAVNTHNYNQPGACRLQVSHEWGIKEDDHSGTFYPVFRIDNGVHVRKEPPPQHDAITLALARFDREANGGSYVVKGMEVLFGGREETQVFSISEGKAHIDGFLVEFPTAMRKEFPVDPDLQTISSEPHPVPSGREKTFRINLSFFPVKDIQAVVATLVVTKNMVHGSYQGVKDPLPDPSVLKLVSVVQGSTRYTAGTDYELTGNMVAWSPGGREPAPGSSYDVTYQYQMKISPEKIDTQGFSLNRKIIGDHQLLIGEIVADSRIDVDYQWMMPRIDLITLDKEGTIRRLKGIAHPHRPQAPRKPDQQFSLAEIRQTWEAQAPEISNQAVRTVSMFELKSMQDQISDLYDLVAIERLRNDANAREPAAKKGIFVDPFFDDDMRDQGEDQSGAVFGGELSLPVAVEVMDPEGAKRQATLEYELETVLNQPMYTGSMAVNPYQAFDPIPPKVTLYPQVDRWTETKTTWASPITRRFTTGRGQRVQVTTTRETQVVSRTQRTAEYLRENTVEFVIINFGPGEKLQEIIFDGLKIKSL